MGPNEVIPQGVNPKSSSSMTANQPSLPYMPNWSLLNSNKIINDPLLHDHNLPPMPTKLPSNIPKFEGNPREYPTNHVPSFHMWFSSNSISKESIHLHLFQRTLTRSTTKGYVNQPHFSHSTFATLSNTFPSYFNIPLRYDTDT